jgi:hypothetical protein
VTGTSRLLITFFLICGLGWTGAAAAQCLLANPSFELPGSGATFAGWNQFGPTGFSTEASHGQRAARVTGPNSGNWDVSGYWQPQSTTPGERWVASVRALNTLAKPLAGGSQAILNIEWRDAGGILLTYESHPVATSASPTDQWIDFSVVSGPAPAGTATARMLLGVLQGPTDPQPEVLYDQATFDPAGPPSLDDRQWNDFPGGRTISFSGRPWRVKGPGYYGPGPNLFCDAPGCTWVDGNGRLHLTVQNISGQWYSTEVVAEEALGYGDYIFTTRGRLDLIDPQVVFGLFLWQYDRCYDPGRVWWNPFNEIDVEFSRWGIPSSDIGQFVAQPYDYPGNISRFDAAFAADEVTSHAFRWLSDRVEYRSWRGAPLDEAPGTLIHSWTYTGPHIPRPEQPRVHLNLWKIAGTPAAAQEVVLDAFTFVPEDSVLVSVPWPGTGDARARQLAPARPNPFAGSTRIRFTLPHAGHADLAVYDIGGRRVRTLASGVLAAGDHIATWDGRDASGLAPAPGLYLYRLSTGRTVETGRMILLR